MSYNFEVAVETNRNSGEIVAVYFQIRSGKAAKVIEKQGGDVFINYDKEGRLLGIEMLAPCEVSFIDEITEAEPETRQFIKRSVPREMMVASD